LKKHPFLLDLLINFAWTWAFWLGAIFINDRVVLLLILVVILGGLGPALAGVLTLELKVPEFPIKPNFRQSYR
jgi:4-hydroxybenzoate polyprenyltransferase